MEEPGGSALDVANAGPITLHDALDALTAVDHNITLLDYGNVVIRKGYQNLTTVRLLGGGVGGRDLSQAIFVGRGMFTAAILGENSVPSSRQILHTIKEVNEGENCGVFVIAQTNADLFNFGLAVERANSDCRTRVRLLTIDDDRSEKKERYSCGFILLVKVLGAMAENGAFFDDIYKCYQDIVDLINTVPLHYVHEEKGPSHHRNIALSKDFEHHLRQVMDKKSSANLHLHPSIPTVALINTSKTLDRLTELGLVKQVIENLRQWGVCLIRMYYGSFVTAAPGTASLTVMKVLDPKIIEYLDAQCEAFGWLHVTQFLPEIKVGNEIPGILKHQGKQPIPLKGPRLGEFQSKVVLKCVQFACDALISCERQLNIMDGENSSGNVGTRLKHFAENISKRLAHEKLPINCPYAFLKKLGIIAESALGGTMGSIYGMLFESAANVFGDLPGGDVISPFSWARALTYASNSIRLYFAENELNMFYPIKCCEAAINKEIVSGQHFIQCYGFGVCIAEEAAQRTKLPGRKYPDAGAHAVGIWMRALFEGVKIVSIPGMCDEM